ncbi:hypothetical protein D3C87_600260 [compost metagenome]
MTKRKVEKEERLEHTLIIRVNKAMHDKLVKLLGESDRQTMAQIVRDILADRKIKCFYKDARLDGPMEEMAMIRKELKAIGININQQTRYFNACKSEAEKRYHAKKTSELYAKMDGKVDRLLEVISKIAEEWLPRS